MTPSSRSAPDGAQSSYLGQEQKKDKTDNRVGGLVTILDPTSPASEAYRGLRTSLLYSHIDRPPTVIVLTSPGPSEGKSTTCVNLGVVLAQAEKNVLIVDCDLRKPAVHTFFELRNIHGIVNVLVGERGVREVWKEPMSGLKVVCTGSIPPNPTELLGSRRLSEFFANVREEFDYVLIDAPPVGPVSDPTILAAQGDGALLVLDAQKSRKVAVRQAIRELEAVGANVLGTVMNNVKRSKEGYYGKEYYGY